MFKDCFEAFDRAFLTGIALETVNDNQLIQQMASDFMDNAYQAYLEAIHQEALDTFSRNVI